MKRILIYIAMILVSVQCNHPFEEGMSGSFPYINLVSSPVMSFDAQGYGTAMAGKIVLNTNMEISVAITYNPSSNDWIRNVRVDNSGNETSVSFTVDNSELRSERSALVKIKANNVDSGISITVSQNAYDMTGNYNHYDGDLYLASQDEVDNCIYTDIRGRLILGKTGSYSYYWPSLSDSYLYFTDNDINDISALYTIRSIENGLIIGGSSGLRDLSGLALDSGYLPVVEFICVSPDLIPTFYCEADELYISHSSQFYGLDFLSSIRNIKKLVMQNNYIYSVYGINRADRLETLYLNNNSISCDVSEIFTLTGVMDLNLSGNSIANITGISNMTGLKRLDLGNNNISNISELAQLKNLQYINLSSLPLSRAQVNYISESIPDAVVEASNLTSNTVSLGLSSTVLSSEKVKLTASISGMQSISEAGIVLVEGSTFDFDYRQTVSSLTSNGQFNLEANTLKNGTTYTAWLYTVDSYGKIYLSDRETFTTNEEILYTYTFTAGLPAYEGTSDHGSITSIKAQRMHYENGTIVTDNITPAAGIGDYSFETNEGQCDMMFYGIGTGTSYMHMENAYVNDEAQWTISASNATGGTGLGTDIVAAATSDYLDNNITKAVSFTRPVAKIAISAEFTNASTAAGVSSLRIDIDNMYSKFTIGTGSTKTYSGNASCSFSATVDPYNTVQTVASGIYVFPNISSGVSNAAITLALTDGSKYLIQTRLPEHIAANTMYNFNIKINYNANMQTFTVEDIEVVTDIIDF